MGNRFIAFKGDANESPVPASLLMNFEQVDPAPLLDGSIYAHTITKLPTTSAYADVGVSKYDSMSLFVGGFYANDHASLDLSTGDFTIEMWIKSAGAVANQRILCRRVDDTDNSTATKYQYTINQSSVISLQISRMPHGLIMSTITLLLTGTAVCSPGTSTGWFRVRDQPLLP